MLNLPIKILRTIQIETAQATVTFDNINTLVAAWDAAKNVTSRHLVVIVNARAESAANAAALRIRFNGSVGNYHRQLIYGQDAAAGALQATASYLYPFDISGVNYNIGGGLFLIPHAFNTTNHKAVLSLGGAAEYILYAGAARWEDIAAITSIELYLAADNFIGGSTFHLGVIDERYLVEEIETGAGLATFDNIPQGEGDLAVIGYARGTQAAVEDVVYHSINDDGVAGNYPAQELTGRAAVAAAASPVNHECAIITADTATANAFGALAVVYSQYIKGNQPHFLSESGYHESTGPTSEVRLMSGRRANIEPINKLEFAPSNGTFVAGSLFSLYRVPKRIIQRVELTAPAATVTFANIPQNFEALILHVYARSSEAAVADEIAITINADGVAANYDFQELTGAVAVVAAARNLASQQLLYIPADNEGAREFGGGSALFPSYAETDRHKHILVIHGQQENRIAISSHRWENLAAIATIALSPVGGPNFLAGSVFELEGVLRKEGLPATEEGMIWGM